MNKAIICFLFAASAMIFYAFQSKPTNQSNNEVTIGSQVWMASNLNVDRFRNGDIISHAKTDKEWEAAWKAKKPAWCYLNNDAEFGKKYGKFYNRYAVLDSRGLAPPGWRIPTLQDFLKLRDFLGGENYAGRKVKSKEGWVQNNELWKEIPGDNSSGFNAFPTGQRVSLALGVRSSGKGMVAVFWSSTWDQNGHFSLLLNDATDNFSVGRLGGDKEGFSVRCIK